MAKPKTETQFAQDLLNLFRAGYQGVQVSAFRSDHVRAVRAVARVAEQYECGCFSWHPVTGFKNELESRGRDPKPRYHDAAPPTGPNGAPINNLIVALDLVENSGDKLPPRCIVIWKWWTEIVTQTPPARGLLCDLLAGDRFSRRTSVRPGVFLTIGEFPVHPALASHLYEMRFWPPDDEALAAAVREMHRTINSNRASRPGAAALTIPDPTPDFIYRAVQALRGLSDKDVRDVLSAAAGEGRGWTPRTLEVIQDFKDAAIGSSSALSPVPWDKIPEEDGIAGMDLFMPWIRRQAMAYQPKADQFTVRRPRGVLLAGVTGCGKSRVASIVSRVLGVKLYKLRWTALKKGIVGASEQSLRETLATLDAIHQGVLLVEEIEKMFAGASAKSAVGDSGVQRGMAGDFIDWMTTHEGKVLVVATCNSVTSLDPEVLDRFTTIWGVGLPDRAERWGIVRIHCRERGIDFSLLESGRDEILDASERFTGRNVVDALDQAHIMSLANPDKGKSPHIWCGQPTVEQVVAALNGTKSTWEIDEEGITEQLKFAQKQCQPVSTALRDYFDSMGDDKDSRPTAV